MTNLLIPEFDEETHIYKVDGKPAPGVTTVLRVCLGANAFWTEEGRENGWRVHLACRYAAENDLDMDCMPEDIKPRLEAYLRFRIDMQWQPDIIEQPLYRRNPLYCGTPDQAQTGRAVIDLKSGSHQPETALQLAAYCFLLPNPHIHERWAVHLQESGKYSLRVFPKSELMSDWAVFQSMMNVYSWKERQ